MASRSRRTGSTALTLRTFAALVDYQDAYQPGARRFDAGQRTKFELIPMAIAALEQILAWQIPRIAATLAQTTADIARQASSLGLDVAPDHQRGPHMLGIGLPKHSRTPAFAALAEANCYVAFRGTSLRISPHLHTTDQDVDRLLDTLARITDPTSTTT